MFGCYATENWAIKIYGGLPVNSKSKLCLQDLLWEQAEKKFEAAQGVPGASLGSPRTIPRRGDKLQTLR